MAVPCPKNVASQEGKKWNAHPSMAPSQATWLCAATLWWPHHLTAYCLHLIASATALVIHFGVNSKKGTNIYVKLTILR